MSCVTFLTGASSGIGRALAPLLAKDGPVALVARRGDLLEEVAAEVREAGGTALPVACDISDRDAVHAALRRCEAELGPVDRVVANAGTSRTNPGTRFDAGILEEIHRVNVLGPAYCFEAVIPGMVERKSGHLVGISSIAAIRGLPRHAAYCSSKAALSSLLESLRIDLKPHGVAVTSVHPGFVKTPLTAKNKFPMPFLLEPEDAARKIYTAIRSRKGAVFFPWQLASTVKATRLLPDALFDKAAARSG